MFSARDHRREARRSSFRDKARFAVEGKQVVVTAI